MIRSLRGNKGRIAGYTASIFGVLGLFFLVVSLLVQYSADAVIRQETLKRNQHDIQTTGIVLASRLTRIVSDLLYICDSFQLSYFDPVDWDAQTELLQQWVAFADHKKVYDQVRYLDVDGNEIIRVNYSPMGSYSVPDSQLQNKKDRYYFQDAIALPEDHVYISCMDLNIENGQIAVPLTPMIRLASPVYTPAHELRGVIVLNYKADDLLTLLAGMDNAITDAFYLLNADGYWLYNSEDSARAWGFMYPGREEDSFAAQYPAEWSEILRLESGTLSTPNGAFTFGRLFTAKAYQVDSGAYPLTLGAGDWYLVSRIRPDTELGMLMRTSVSNLIKTTLRNTYYVYFMILFIAFLIALLLAANRIERDTIKFYSEYDAMTGVLNRRAGLHLLHTRYENGADRRCRIGLCFLDINGLKEVNDTLGHEMGDELITSVTGIIQKNLREHDTVVRLGGDEFLIIFDGLEEAECEAAWQRIAQSADEVNRAENRRYRISVSHGIETFRCGAAEDIDDVLNRADEKMYAEKRAIKADLKVIRQPAADSGANESAGL